MNKKLYIVLLCTALITCSCDKMQYSTSQKPVKFEVFVQNRLNVANDDTRSDLWNESGQNLPLSDYTDRFYVSAWNDANGGNFIPTGTEVSLSGGEWITHTKYYWTENVTKTIFAYANLPQSGCGILCNSKNYLTLSLTVPDDPAKQADVLLGFYHGQSDHGHATIHFIHPLTSVKFKVGVLAGGLSIVRLSIVKLAATGTVKINPDGSFSAWNVSKFDKTITLKDEEVLVDGDNNIGETLLLIPQNLTENPVSVVLELNDGNIVTSTLSSGYWAPGVTYTYTIDYDNPD